MSKLEERWVERARRWLIRVTGWVGVGQAESLGRELEAVYEEGRQSAGTGNENENEEGASG